MSSRQSYAMQASSSISSRRTSPSAVLILADTKFEFGLIDDGPGPDRRGAHT